MFQVICVCTKCKKNKLCETLQEVTDQGQQISRAAFDYTAPIKANILSNIYFIKLLGTFFGCSENIKGVFWVKYSIHPFR